MKSRNSTLPDLKNTLRFCLFLCDCTEEDYQNNLDWVRETRQHRHNLKMLMEVMESEEKMVTMGKKQFASCVKVFGAELAGKIFKDVKIVEEDTKPTDIVELLSKMKAGNAGERTKVIKQQPTGFFNEEARKGFQDALFSRKSNGYHEAVWPKVATTFSELRQIEAQGELAQQFEMLVQNILQSSEYDPATKAQKLASLASEYSSLVSGQKGKR